MPAVITTLFLGLFVAPPEEVYVCNPQFSARSGWMRISPTEGLAVDVPPLACVKVPLTRRPLGNEKPLAGLFLARPAGAGLYAIIAAPPGRAVVVDANANGRPDFAGDRWLFDADGDGLAETIVAMSDANADGRAEQIAFYSSGEYWLGVKAKREADRRAKSSPAENPPKRRLDVAQATALPWNPGIPTSLWQDKNGDGTWCRGSILEGGEVSCDWVVLDREHETWHGRMKEIRHYDLDGDGDVDIRAFAGATAIQRGANFDGSDQAPNPLATCDLWAGTGFYRWPGIEDESWRERFGTFDMRKNSNTSFADLAAKYDLWMNMQDAPHGVYDLDGDGLRDAFIGASVSGGPSDVLERPGQPPAVWHTLERLFVGLAGPRQLNFNLDVNPLKRQRPDRNLSLAIKTYRDRWGNELANFVGAFSPPADWDGRALSPYASDGSAAPWTWLWDWHLTRPFRDLYVAAWVKDWKHAGEGAAVNIAMQDYRVEGDFDCSSDFALYWSPIINAFHLRGVEWGWWNITTPKPREIEARWGDLAANYGLFPANQFSYATELLDTDIRRFYATRWACYFDRDADEIIDTYLFDTDNNGLFDTRLWYDRRAASLLWAEGNRFRRAPLRLEFPAKSFALANYRKLRDFYQKMLREHEPLVKSDGQIRISGGRDTEPEATVGLDLYHAGAAWHDTGRRGFSRLVTGISRRPVAVATLATPFSPKALARLTQLVVTGVRPDKALTDEELAALDKWLRSGGRLLVVLPEPDGQQPPSTAALAARYGVAVDGSQQLDLRPGPLERFTDGQGEALQYPFDQDGFCLDSAWPLRPAEGATPLVIYKGKKKQEQPVILAAAARVGKGAVLVCGARSLLDNRYTAYKLPKTRPFDRRRFSNRAFLEETLHRLLP